MSLVWVPIFFKLTFGSQGETLIRIFFLILLMVINYIQSFVNLKCLKTIIHFVIWAEETIFLKETVFQNSF